MIKLARIDNRLLHGIVASQWAPNVNALRLMVIDDDIANDEFSKSAMRMAKPAGYALSIITMETAMQNFKNNKYQDQTIFLVVKDPVTILKLAEEGVAIEKVNIGATAEKKNEMVLSNQASITKEELEIYNNLSAKGIEVFVQYILSDTRVPLKAALK
ncbi:PTS system mannose/fructose/N-acetylgalactosamine-transporter subunit IIB [Amphibacillus sp. Q70]|uniref:PTS system mannose/fructose/N-acetylgalactosamine-transporter subunit IIB n=1 Tax=Amphibacillus sp. Q70 TaxID=3453416 RepID=UPI003F84CF79